MYLIDQPSRGRSPWQQSVDGPLGTFDTYTVSSRFTGVQNFDLWPNASLHTQWPGSGLAGDPVFDEFYASMVPLLVTDSESGEKNQHALVALLNALPVSTNRFISASRAALPTLAAETRYSRHALAVRPLRLARCGRCAEQGARYRRARARRATLQRRYI